MAKTYFALDEKLSWGVLRNLISGLQQGSYWQSLARTALHDDFHQACQGLTQNLALELAASDGRTLDDWWEDRASGLKRYLGLMEKLQTESNLEIDSLTVLIKELRSIKTRSE